MNNKNQLNSCFLNSTPDVLENIITALKSDTTLNTNINQSKLQRQFIKEINTIKMRDIKCKFNKDSIHNK